MKRLWKSGEPFIWLTGGALALALLLVAGLVALILANGLGLFWPRDVVRMTLADGKVMTGQQVEREAVPGKPREYPPDAVVVERTEWGLLIGTIQEVRDGGRTVAVGSARGLDELRRQLPEAARLREEIRRIEKGDIGAINFAQDRVRLALKRLEIKGVTRGPDVDALQSQMGALQARYREQEARLAGLRKRQTASVVVTADDGKEKDLPLVQVLNVYAPNTMGVFAKSGHYAAGVWEFVSDDPREANTEGGVFPAIFGTVMMVMIMSIMVTPLGVLAAFYLREYARQGTFVSAVRIAVNNLAGVPSIVFGVFGVGFFIYFVGGTIDRWFFAEAL